MVEGTESPVVDVPQAPPTEFPQLPSGNSAENPSASTAADQPAPEAASPGGSKQTADGESTTDGVPAETPDSNEPVIELTPEQQKDNALAELADLGVIPKNEEGVISPEAAAIFANMDVADLQARLQVEKDVQARVKRVEEFQNQGFIDPDGDPEVFAAEKLLIEAMTEVEANQVLLASQIENNPQLKEALVNKNYDEVLSIMAKTQADMKGISEEEAMEQVQEMADEYKKAKDSGFGGAFMEYLTKTYEDTMEYGFGDLVDAMIQGADYAKAGGGGSGWKNGNEGQKTEAVGGKLFVDRMRANPPKFAEGLRQALYQDQGLFSKGWRPGDEVRSLLDEAVKASSSRAMEIIQLVFMGSIGEDESQKLTGEPLVDYLFKNKTEDERNKHWGAIKFGMGPLTSGGVLGDEVRNELLKELYEKRSESGKIRSVFQV